jgi:hypothetical protein
MSTRPSSLFYGRRTAKDREASAFHLFFDQSQSAHLIAAWLNPNPLPLSLVASSDSLALSRPEGSQHGRHGSKSAYQVHNNIQQPPLRVHANWMLWFLSGNERIRWPVALKKALSTAGPATQIVGSPTPPQKPPLGMTIDSTLGIWPIRIES